MKEYALSKHLVKNYKAQIIINTILSLSILSAAIIDITTNDSYKWSSVVVNFLFAVLWGVIALFYLKNVLEPAARVTEENIKIKIGYTFWETAWTNLSHMEVKTEYIDKIKGNHEYEYINFKEPITRYVSIFGISLWKISKNGFRLDVLEDGARKEIKAKLS